MLDCSRQIEVIPVWEEIESRAALPVSPSAFFAKQGSPPTMPGSRRQFHRAYWRTKCIVNYGGVFHASYLVDYSRAGIGIVTPIQMLPCSPFDLWLPDEHHFEATCKRCVRIEADSFHCGAVLKNADDVIAAPRQ